MIWSTSDVNPDAPQNWLNKSIGMAWSSLYALVDHERERMRWWSRGAIGEPRDTPVSRLVGGWLPPTSLGRGARALGHAIRHGSFPDWEAGGAQRVIEKHRSATLADREQLLSERGLDALEETTKRNPFRRAAIFRSLIKSPTVECEADMLIAI